MALGNLPVQTRFNDSGIANCFNGTWGHMAPKKNISYKGLIRFCLTNHSHYGCQPIIILYDFPNLQGPYIHDFLFDKICDMDTESFIEGHIYEMQLTFRNYRFYYSNPVRVF